MKNGKEKKWDGSQTLDEATLSHLVVVL
jgi:hypothetical protein